MTEKIIDDEDCLCQSFLDGTIFIKKSTIVVLFICFRNVYNSNEFWEKEKDFIMDIYEILAKNTRTLRIAKEMSQDDLAEKAKINKKTVAQIENKQKKRIGLNTICILADALECDVSTLLDGRPITDEDDWNITVYRKSDACIDVCQYKREEIDIHKTYYPPINDDYHKITSLLEIIPHLALYDYYDLIEVSSRISGAIVNHEDYVVEQLQLAYQRIPESEAKKYADFVLEDIKAIRKNGRYTRKTLAELDERGYDAYVQMIQDKKDMILLIKEIMRLLDSTTIEDEKVLLLKLEELKKYSSVIQL